MATCFILAELDVPDEEAYRASGYMAMAEASVARHGGRFVVRGGKPELLEGDALPGRVVVLEFPSRQAALAFYRSEDYAPAITLRQSLSSGRLVLLEGVWALSEGYLLLATGPAKYIEMARNLAASIRVMDGTRRICLVHDENAVLEAGDERFFDDTAVLRDDPLYPGFMNKIRLFPASPYERAMFVDADCLLVKRDIDRYWEVARPHFFAITGDRRTRGEWKGADVAELLRQEGAPYLVAMNSGVFCFDNSGQAREFFTGLNDFYLRRRESLGVGLHRGRPAQTDEIYIGLWMGLNGMDSYGGKFGEDSWMVSTWRAFWMTLDPARGISVLRKPKRSIAGIPNPLGGWDRLSPSFVHFIGLKPPGPYRRLAGHFRAAVAASGRSGAGA